MGNKSSSLATAAPTALATTTIVETIISTPAVISSAIHSSSLQPAGSISSIIVQSSVPEPAAASSISSVIITTTPTPTQILPAPLISSSVTESSSLQESTRESSSSSKGREPASASSATEAPSALSAMASGKAESSTLMSQSGGVARVSATESALADLSTPAPSSAFAAVDRTQPKVGPFSPEAAILGGIPTKGLDVPVTAIFLVLFLIGAVTHFAIHEINGKRGHKFHLSDMVFDFCMVRTVTCTMRIVWAFRPKNNSIVLAAEIFENAGVVVLFAVNVIFTQRILRAIHPYFGWNPTVSKFFFALLASVPMIIVWNIISLTVSFFTLNPKTLNTSHHLLFFGGSYNLFLCMFPIFVVGLASSIPSPTPMEKFGAGRFRYKVILLLFASFILSVGTLIRLIGAAWVFPIDAPGLIDRKATFYTTGFMLEIIVVFVYAVGRIDLKFHVPDGCTGPGDYSRSSEKQEDEENLFQDIDVKMRMSISQTLDAQEWDDGVSISSRASREQVQQAIQDLKLNSEIVGQPIDTGDSELLLYAFKVKKPDYGYYEPRRPPRTSNWMNVPREAPREGGYGRMDGKKSMM